uniref:MICOS complex subunit MIC13 n=1 Tax=Nothobranchius furzeri TaxID=105023 RepID=A0A8C6PY27_NOTFU
MAARILPLLKLATKVTIAGGAVYVACDSGLLGTSEQGSEALEKARAAIPPAIEEWMKYFGLEAQVPAIPKIEISPVEAWNSGKNLVRIRIPLLVPQRVNCNIAMAQVQQDFFFNKVNLPTKTLEYYPVSVIISFGIKYSLTTVISSITGVRWTISSLSEAPTKASEYASQGVQYAKDLIK